MPWSRTILPLAVIVMAAAGICLAQNFRGRGFGGGFGGRGFDYRGSGSPDAPLISTEGGVTVNEDTVRTARETATHSTGTPNWTNPPGFTADTFTFARVMYN